MIPNTYNTEITFDIPTSRETAQKVIEEADLDEFDQECYQHPYPDGPDVTPGIDDAVRTALDEATKGALDISEPFDLVRFDRNLARLEITVHYPDGRGSG